MNTSSPSVLQSFFGPADELPDVRNLPAGIAFSKRLLNATIPGISRAIEHGENDLLKHLCVDFLEATEFVATPWAPARRVPGTKVRRLRYRLRLPDDVPSVIKKAVNIPGDTSITVLARVGGIDDKLVLLQQACSHDVPFGERMWVQGSF